MIYKAFGAFVITRTLCNTPYLVFSTFFQSQYLVAIFFIFHPFYGFLRVNVDILLTLLVNLFIVFTGTKKFITIEMNHMIWRLLQPNFRFPSQSSGKLLVCSKILKCSNKNLSCLYRFSNTRTHKKNKPGTATETIRPAMASLLVFLSLLLILLSCSIILLIFYTKGSLPQINYIIRVKNSYMYSACSLRKKNCFFTPT